METNKTQLQQQSKLLSGRQRVQPSEDAHQLEFVAEVNGMSFINDSKSTRLSATRNSLEKIETSVVLIIGGSDDGENDYATLSSQIKGKVVAIVYLGSDSNAILKHYSSYRMLYANALTLSEAVQIACAFGQSGDAVLYSPACNNADYKNSGNEFKAIVKGLL
jgi:UDP-N-acetylmuramoylalanine--D-glutamate ligase